MSDFITELRREVVGAHAAHHRRSARASRIRRWRPALAGAVAIAALLIGVVAAVRSLESPEPTGEPHVIKLLQLGGLPVDGVLADGSLWVTDSSGNQVVRIDLATRRVAARIALGGSPQDVAAGPAGVWLRGDRRGADAVSHIDTRANRVAGTVDGPGGGALAVGENTVWISRRFNEPEGIEGLDPASGRITRRIAIPDTDTLAVAGGTLWTIRHDGSVVRINAATGDIEQRWPALAPSSATADSSEAIVADNEGVWILSTEKATIFRLQGDRVVRQIPADESAEPILAYTGGGLWTVSGDAARGRYRLSRLDPLSGELTATVDLGAHRPRALVPTRGGLWAVCGDGTAVLIKT